MLDARGDLRFRGVAKFQLVEDVTREPRISVRTEQAIIKCAGIVGARCGESLMAGLDADSCRHGREACIEGRELHFEPAFLLAIGECLAHAVAQRVSRIGEADLIVFVVGRAQPKADCIDRDRVGAILALRREFGLLRINARVRVVPLDAGNAIERVGLRHRCADEAAVEDVGTADRSAAALRGRIGLLAVK